MTNHTFLRYLGIILLSVSLCWSVPSLARNSNKWRIEVSGGANSDGTVVLTLQEKGQELLIIRTTIKAGTSENNVAKRIRNAFEGQVPLDRFKVEVDDGEDVLVKKRFRANRFKLELVEETIRGTRIKLDRE